MILFSGRDILVLKEKEATKETGVVQDWMGDLEFLEQVADQPTKEKKVNFCVACLLTVLILK